MTKRAHLELSPAIIADLMSLSELGIMFDSTRPVTLTDGEVLRLPLIGDGLPHECTEEGGRNIRFSLSRHMIEWNIGYISNTYPHDLDREYGVMISKYVPSVHGTFGGEGNDN